MYQEQKFLKVKKMEFMQKEQNGWVVINIGHPRTGAKYIVGEK